MTLAKYDRLTAWANRYAIPLESARELSRLIRRHANQQEHWCNGDPHPKVADPRDKNANAQAWALASDATDLRLDTLAKQYGFTVDYGVGFYPVLIRDTETCIMVPV